MNKIKKLAIGVSAAAIMFSSFAGGAFADSPRPHRPDVMSATPDTYNANWVTGVSQDGGAKGQSIILGDNSTDATDFAYYSFRNWWDQNLSDVKKVRASFMAGTDTVNSGGSPRFSLELDANGDGDFVEPTGNPSDEDVNVYLDPATCSDPAATGGGWVESDFTGDKTNCTITDSKGNVYVSDASGTAWSKLVAEYPDAKVWFMFLIQDATVGTNYVDRIMLDSAFFTKQP
ncbi:MAG: hypothetical protein Q7K55_01645 [Candidatus Levybacteria bacterium]|nr:hypothetical protein [Candidatus Levybacteria bacterium]